MRISDWSSDVCSSDLCVEPTDIQVEGVTENLTIRPFAAVNFDLQRLADQVVARILLPLGDRLKQQVLDRTHAGDARFMVSAMEELIFPLQKLVQPILWQAYQVKEEDRKSTRLNSSH